MDNTFSFTTETLHLNAVEHGNDDIDRKEEDDVPQQWDPAFPFLMLEEDINSSGDDAIIYNPSIYTPKRTLQLSKSQSINIEDTKIPAINYKPVKKRKQKSNSTDTPINLSNDFLLANSLAFIESSDYQTSDCSTNNDNICNLKTSTTPSVKKRKKVMSFSKRRKRHTVLSPITIDPEFEKLLQRLKSENRGLRKSRNSLRKDNRTLEKIKSKLRYKLDIIFDKFRQLEIDALQSISRAELKNANTKNVNTKNKRSSSSSTISISLSIEESLNNMIDRVQIIAEQYAIQNKKCNEQQITVIF